jgi:antitoxin component YwqK of YwqJK toxin-antitoxin module
MLQNYILTDILQYIFNLYIDYNTQADILEKVINTDFKFNKNCHIYQTTRNVSSINGYTFTISTFVDNDILKKENYFSDRIKIKEENYLNNSLDGKVISWYRNGNLQNLKNYMKGFILNEELYDKYGNNYLTRDYGKYTYELK